MTASFRKSALGESEYYPVHVHAVLQSTSGCKCPGTINIEAAWFSRPFIFCPFVRRVVHLRTVPVSPQRSFTRKRVDAEFLSIHAKSPMCGPGCQRGADL